METTHHAKIRMQQRSIPPLIADWLEIYGEEAHDNHGGRILFFGKHSHRMIKSDVGTVFYNKIRSMLNAYKVVRDGTTITVGRRYKKIIHSL